MVEPLPRHQSVWVALKLFWLCFAEPFERNWTEARIAQILLPLFSGAWHWDPRAFPHLSRTLASQLCVWSPREIWPTVRRHWKDSLEGKLFLYGFDTIAIQPSLNFGTQSLSQRSDCMTPRTRQRLYWTQKACKHQFGSESPPHACHNWGRRTQPDPVRLPVMAKLSISKTREIAKRREPRGSDPPHQNQRASAACPAPWSRSPNSHQLNAKRLFDHIFGHEVCLLFLFYTATKLNWIETICDSRSWCTPVRGNHAYVHAGVSKPLWACNRAHFESLSKFGAVRGERGLSPNFVHKRLVFIFLTHEKTQLKEAQIYEATHLPFGSAAPVQNICMVSSGCMFVSRLTFEFNEIIWKAKHEQDDFEWLRMKVMLKQVVESGSCPPPGSMWGLHNCGVGIWTFHAELRRDQITHASLSLDSTETTSTEPTAADPKRNNFHKKKGRADHWGDFYLFDTNVNVFFQGTSLFWNWLKTTMQRERQLFKSKKLQNWVGFIFRNSLSV